MTVGLNEYLYLSAVLFAIGFFGVLLRKNTLVIYMCLELMLVASTVALVAFSRFNGTMDGNVFVFFILTVAAAEVAVGLAIIVALFRRRQTIPRNVLGGDRQVGVHVRPGEVAGDGAGQDRSAGLRSGHDGSLFLRDDGTASLHFLSCQSAKTHCLELTAV